MQELTPASQLSLAHQAMTWLKLNHEELVDDFLSLAAPSDPNYYRGSNTDQHRQIPTSSLKALIERLEGKPFPAHEFKQHCLRGFERGANLGDLTERGDLVLEVIKRRVHNSLSDQPQLSELLLNRAAYIVQLFKATLITAFIEFQTRA